MERLLLSLSLSLATVTLVLFILNYVWSLTLIPSLISVTVFILVMSAIGWWRQRKLVPGERFTLSFQRLPDFKLNAILRNRRSISWILFIALTVLVLTSPLKLNLEPFPIESLHIFSNLPLFTVIFSLWAAVLFYLLFSRSSAWSDIAEKVALAVVIALVFNGFWIINSPYGWGGDHMACLSAVNIIRTQGQFSVTQELTSQNYPGAFILGGFFSDASGLSLFHMATVFRLETSMLVAALMAFFLIRSLKNPRAAMLAFITVTIIAATLSPAGDPSRALAFRADIFSGVYWSAFVVLIFRREEQILGTITDNCLFLLLLAAMTITYIGHSYLLIFVMAAIFIVQKWGRETRSIELVALCVSIIAVVTWSFYIATSSFHNFSRVLPVFVSHLISGEFLYTFSQSAGVGGGEAPFWMTLMGYVRWAFFGLGTLLTIGTFIFARKIGSLMRREVGIVLGIGAFTLFFTVLQERGFQVSRYLWYAPFFLAPILVRPLFQLTRIYKQLCLGLAGIILICFSLPSFLIYYGSSFSTWVMTDQDIAAGEFLNSNYGHITDLRVYTNRQWGDITFFYLPDADVKGPHEPYTMSGTDDLWVDLDGLVSEFQDPKTPSLFVFSSQASLIWYHHFGILPDAEQWQTIKSELAGKAGANLVFSNDYMQVYANPAAVAINASPEN